MKIPSLQILSALLLAGPFLFPGAAQAQFTANNQTISISSATTTVLNPYQIGGGFNTNTLAISSGGTLTFTAGGNQQLQMGVATGNINNSLTIDGAGASLSQPSGEFKIGMVAGGNTVTVSNGGTLSAGLWGTSISASSGTGNSVTVTDAGSSFTTATININAGGSNSVSVLNGGLLNVGGIFNVGNYSSSNAVTVSGVNSVANVNALITVGNTNLVSNNNAITVGTGGTLNVKDTGNTGAGILIAGLSGATGNKVQIDGGTLNVVSAGSSTPGIDVRKGALILNSGTVNTERLIANTDATSVVTLNGGTLSTQGTTIANSAVFTVGNGSSTATLKLDGGNHSFANGITLANNATLTGTGTITSGTLIVSSGSTLSPGNSPGTLTAGATTLNGGGNYNWQVVNATGAAGTGFDTINLTTGSVLTLANTSGNKFNINLWSLSSTGPDVNGNASNFNNAVNQSWTLIATDQAIGGFDAAAFTVNVGAFNGTTGFSNALGGGSFSLALGDSNTDLLLVYTIPEPSTTVLLGIGLTTALILRRRRA